ncbi:hypothetical protein HOY80DRAFT_648431 [Tuber brumale]|nr:hypothetical protein HOY80DRAFT_648431 [Tuber brumale]
MLSCQPRVCRGRLGVDVVLFFAATALTDWELGTWDGRGEQVCMFTTRIVIPNIWGRQAKLKILPNLFSRRYLVRGWDEVHDRIWDIHAVSMGVHCVHRQGAGNVSFGRPQSGHDRGEKEEWSIFPQPIPSRASAEKEKEKGEGETKCHILPAYP